MVTSITNTLCCAHGNTRRLPAPVERGWEIETSLRAWQGVPEGGKYGP